ncbi:acyl carrier protein [Paenibacillus sp. LPE1-1-1.1]|uniref:acyl carrier protein n=1 Tax=Paenibacillus sp. LPE1-1-1.1 TaxID=3135230 RepID=UPI00341C180A
MLHDHDPSVSDFVKAKIGELLEIKDAVGMDLDLRLLGMDSLKTITLIVTIENEFDLTFDDEELMLDNLETIDKIVRKIQHKRGCLHES